MSTVRKTKAEREFQVKGGQRTQQCNAAVNPERGRGVAVKKAFKTFKPGRLHKASMVNHLNSIGVLCGEGKECPY